MIIFYDFLFYKTIYEAGKILTFFNYQSPFDGIDIDSKNKVDFCTIIKHA